MKEHRYQWDGVIVGYSLSALIYAFYTGMPVVGYPSSAPWNFEKIREIDLSAYGMGSGKIKHQIDLWDHLYMILSMGGQLPFADNAASIRVDDSSLVVTTANRSRIVRGDFSTAWVFDDDKIEGMPDILNLCDTYRVVDWFDVRSGMRHGESKLIEPSEDFVRNIYFYPSERLHGNHADKKDLCSESFLSEDQLDEFEYSPTYARFKVISKMKEVGIRGARNGSDSNGNPKHYAIKIEFQKRRIRKTDMHKYAETPNIVFNRIEPHMLLNECLANTKPYGDPRPANPYIPKVLLTP